MNRLLKYGNRVKAVSSKVPETELATHFYTKGAQYHRAQLPRGITFPDQVFTLIKSGKTLGPNEVAFRVPLNMNKIQIKSYLEEIYRVPVMNVNTAIYLGKKRLTSKGFYYKRPDWKKALVTLTQPFKIPEFVNVVDTKKKPATTASS